MTVSGYLKNKINLYFEVPHAAVLWTYTATYCTYGLCTYTTSIVRTLPPKLKKQKKIPETKIKSALLKLLIWKHFRKF